MLSMAVVEEAHQKVVVVVEEAAAMDRVRVRVEEERSAEVVAALVAMTVAMYS